MAHPPVIYRRCTSDPKFWWHWETTCNIFRAAGMQKKRGLVFVYITKTDGLHPTTYHLCPGCLSLAARRKSKCWPNYVKKVVVLPGCIAPRPLPPPPVYTVPRYYYNNTVVTPSQ